MPVTVKEKRLIIDGKPVRILSGEVHYWRLDPENWRPILETAKECGLTMIATYVPWRVHEAERGKFDFGESGNANLDLAAFLTLCQEMGFYVFLRPGPLIVSEMTHGGLPDWLFEDPDMLTWNSQDKAGKFGSFADAGNPCYLHPKYLEIARTWLTKVNDIARPYFHTNGGPIVIVQLDNEVSMICLDSYFASEYNPVVVGPDGFYHQWLKNKYENIHQVPYKDKPSLIREIEPPRSLPTKPGEGDEAEEIPVSFEDDIERYFDWAEFKEDFMAEYVAALARIERGDNLRTEIFAVNFNPHRPLDVPNCWWKIERAADNGITGYDYYKRSHMRWEDFQKTALSARYSCAVTKLPWSPEWMCGIWGDDFGGDGVVGPQHTEFLYTVGLAYGLVGFNHYMYAEREHWSFCPVNEFGQKRYNFEALQAMTALHKELDPPSLEIDSRVGLLYARKYQWLPYIEDGFAARDDQVQIGKRTVDGTKNGETAKEYEGLFSLLLQLSYAPTIITPEMNFDDAYRMKVLIVPCQERMDPSLLEMIYNVARTGVRIVFDPDPPVKDWDGKPLEIKAPANADIVSTGKRFAQSKWGKETEEERETLRQALNGIGPAVETGDPDVPAVLHSRGRDRYLFVMNLNNRSKMVTVSLPFECRDMTDMRSGEKLPVENGKITLPVDCKFGRILKARVR